MRPYEGTLLIKSIPGLVFKDWTFFFISTAWKYFSVYFCSERITGCLGFSIHVQLLKIKEEPNPFTLRLRRIHFSFESQCKFCELPLQAAVAWRPWAGLYSERQQSSVMASGRFSWTAKTHEELKRLCVAEEKKRLSFIIQMKWGPADGGRRAEGLWQKTSCSLPLWFQSARDEIKSSKGISDRDGSH